MKRDEFGPFQEFVQFNLFNTKIPCPLNAQERVVANDLHRQAQGSLANC